MEQGIQVICCTISMFDKVREWNRQNIQNYTEIYVKVPLEVLKKRNQKGLYQGAAEGQAGNVVGMDLALELPANPDIVLENDGARSPEELCGELLGRIGE